MGRRMEKEARIKGESMKITRNECQWLVEPQGICENSNLPCEKHKNCIIKRKIRAIRAIRKISV